MNDAKSKIENKKVLTNAIREEIRSYQFEISEESNEFEDLQMIFEGLTKNGNAEKFYSKYYATIALQATKYFPGLSRNSATLLATARRYSYPLVLLMMKLRSLYKKKKWLDYNI